MCYEMVKINELNEMLSEQKISLRTFFFYNHGNHFKNISEGINDLQEEKRLVDKMSAIESRHDQIKRKLNQGDTEIKVSILPILP